MTPEARYNLQKGKEEDKRFAATDYTPDGSFLDNYIIASAKSKKKIMNRYQERNQAAADKKTFNLLEKEIEKTIEQEIEKVLKEVFKK